MKQDRLESITIYNCNNISIPLLLDLNSFQFISSFRTLPNIYGRDFFENN